MTVPCCSLFAAPRAAPRPRTGFGCAVPPRPANERVASLLHVPASHPSRSGPRPLQHTSIKEDPRLLLLLLLLEGVAHARWRGERKRRRQPPFQQAAVKSGQEPEEEEDEDEEAMDREGSTSSAAPGGDYDDEPVLKYQRMGADVGKLLSSGGGDAAGDAEGAGEGKKGKEAVVRMLVHDTCLVGCCFFGVPQALGAFSVLRRRRLLPSSLLTLLVHDVFELPSEVYRRPLAQAHLDHACSPRTTPTDSYRRHRYYCANSSVVFPTLDGSALVGGAHPTLRLPIPMKGASSSENLTVGARPATTPLSSRGHPRERIPPYYFRGTYARIYTRDPVKRWKQQRTPPPKESKPCCPTRENAVDQHPSQPCRLSCTSNLPTSGIRVNAPGLSSKCWTGQQKHEENETACVDSSTALLDPAYRDRGQRSLYSQEHR